MINAALYSPVLMRYFLALLNSVVAVLTGIAIIPVLKGAFEAAIVALKHRDASILALLVTASGLSLFRVGSVFWGILIGQGAMIAGRFLHGRASNR